MLLVTDRSYFCHQSVVILGMFDGIHIGHQVLIRKGRVLADRHRVPLVVCTFANHPLDVIAPERAPKQLTTLQERAYEMEKLGVDVLVAQSFTKEVMSLAPEEYIGYLVQRFHPRELICGYNHTFGKNGEGKPNLLTVIGASLGFRTWVVPQITLEGTEVSSTKIRQLLAQGDIPLANKLLGRQYAVKVVPKGNAFTVQNLGKQMPPDGQYRCLLEDGKQVFPCQVQVVNEVLFPSLSIKNQETVIRFISKSK